VEAAVVVGVAGALAEAAAWWAIASRGADLWRLMPPVLVAIAVAAAVVRPPVLASRVDPGAAWVVGAAAGIGLYVATRAFVAVATRSTRFRAATRAIYGRAEPVAIWVALALSLVVTAPAEEVFWRGLVQGGLDDAAGPAVAAGVAWLGYVAVNLASRSAPIVLAAAVGGAVWAGLGWWSGGVAASLASHILWTGLMLGLPPKPGREVLRA
jgi:membrane protease YdiL (CAAX protease family)